MPALVIIDEHAELADDAPDAVKHADSIARRGRAVAVNLIAAIQRPTQKAMGHGAVRSQMDIRICFRVRERKDVDLILGQGMLTAGWNAHTLNAPGKFLVSAAEHDTPREIVRDMAASKRKGHLSRPRMWPLTCGLSSALGGTRTPNLLIRSQMLYPLSYERWCLASLRHSGCPVRQA